MFSSSCIITIDIMFHSTFHSFLVTCVNSIIVECPSRNETFPMECDNGTTCHPHVVSRWYFSNKMCQK
jgi:hypothetical protein